MLNGIEAAIGRAGHRHVQRCLTLSALNGIDICHSEDVQV